MHSILGLIVLIPQWQLEPEPIRPSLIFPEDDLLQRLTSLHLSYLSSINCLASR